MILNNSVLCVDLSSDNEELLNDIMNEINRLLEEHYV